eukprot:CAMPEP_0172684368 /NCGR_PEP_ID=MMETSP1074-20121228/19504_1 /TAXON_ID=2916 /ORGANISM="Ceratium fusus, Strain PA161109" /LENGTH=333 /DNA_ID=CAMNT_0013503369 /DNA_START=75 /DNA_END=1076 /DNA_ORIENTATION=-
MLIAHLLALFLPSAARPPTVTLRNKVELPLVSAGVWQYNSSVAEASILAAVKAGFTAVDTALDYWNQDGVGRAIQKAIASQTMRREDIFVETKVPGCGNPLENTTRNPFDCYASTARNLAFDLEQLNLTYVDLVIIHFPPFPSFIVRSCGEWTGSCQMARAQWKAMVEFYKAGKARAIGVSNYCPSCFECLRDSEVFPMVNQVMYHVGMGADPGGIVSYGRKMGVVTQAYSSLGNNPFTKHADVRILKGNLTTGIAKSHNVSTVQLALKYIISQGIAAVTKSSNPAHLKSDLDLWSWDLSEKEMDQLQAFEIPGVLQKYSFACSSAQQQHLVV